MEIWVELQELYFIENFRDSDIYLLILITPSDPDRPSTFLLLKNIAVTKEIWVSYVVPFNQSFSFKRNSDSEEKKP